MPRNVRWRTLEKARRIAKLDFEPAERRDDAVAGSLAHRFLARPVAQELPPPRVGRKPGDPPALRGARNFFCSLSTPTSRPVCSMSTPMRVDGATS
jgi:hypothetical protein